MLGDRLPEGGINALVRERVATATARRAAIGLPNDQTTAYRLLNGEGDGLPGVMCDRFGSLASIELTTAAAEAWLPTLLDCIDAPQISVRVPKDSARMEGIAPGDRFGRAGDHPEEHVELRENGLLWRLKPGKGQKTGFYTDQRENRAAVGALVAGGSVLDAFCYTGGFGLNAARAGATEVVGVDSSGPAISVAAGTAKLNGLDGVSTWHKEDALRYMRSVGERQFDMVILDPPKLARSRDGLEDAYRKYRAFNTHGLARVRAGGWFVSCSCSSRVDETMFLRMLTDAAHLAKRRLTIHRVTGAGPDYPIPVSFSEGRYLICVVGSVV